MGLSSKKGIQGIFRDPFLIWKSKLNIKKLIFSFMIGAATLTCNISSKIFHFVFGALWTDCSTIKSMNKDS